VTSAGAESVSYMVQDEPDPQLRAEVISQLVDYNSRRASPEHHQPLGVFACRAGITVGGALGYTHWNWLFVSHLWVQDEERSSGIGSTLLAQMEDKARSRGVDAIHLDTYDFQALPFYRRLGYQEFGQLEEYPRGHSRHFLWKHLT